MDIQRNQDTLRNTNYQLTLQVVDPEYVSISQNNNNNNNGFRNPGSDELYFYVQLCIREVDDTSNLNFFLEKSELSNAEHVYMSIGFYLEQHGLCGSDREEIQQQLSSFTRLISWNGGRAFVPIFIEVGIFVVQQLQVQSDGRRPSAESAVRTLEKLRLRRDGDDVQRCAISQEEFLVGIEVTSLPCSHIYHGDCIVKWLRTSHCCPLCRFKMPSTCS